MALFVFQSRQRTSDEIVAHYGVSLQLCAWRVPMTGVDAQVRRSRENALKLVQSARV
jgi:hypothetical protein